jgi:hypothetical protein
VNKVTLSASCVLLPIVPTKPSAKGTETTSALAEFAKIEIAEGLLSLD